MSRATHPLVGCPHSLVYLHLPVVEGLIFCISATPHLGTSFPLFHACELVSLAKCRRGCVPSNDAAGDDVQCTVCIVTVSIVSIICQDQSPLESEEGLPPQHRTWSRYLNMWGMENIILTGALSIPNITYMSVVCSPDSVLYVSGQLFCNIVRCSCAALRLSLIVGKL